MPYKRTAWFMMVVSFLGFVDASYLTAKHYLGTALTCALFEGCDVVTTSKYSEILGVPVSLLGAVYYFSVFIFVAYYLDSQKFRSLPPKGLIGSLSLAAYASMAGFAASIAFMYIQFFVLKALCIYCLFSALTSTLLFIAGGSMLLYSKKMRDQ